jgi:hypothetical protein
MDTLEERRMAAIEYLRSRGKYILDGKFTPTSAAATNIGETVKRYQKDLTSKRKQ